MRSYASAYKICVPTLPPTVSTGRLDRAVPAHQLIGYPISWYGRRYRFCPRGVSSNGKPGGGVGAIR
jgi:hypothetical protein